MDSNYRLIAEAYINQSRFIDLIGENTILTEQEESWWRLAAKVLDPTGILSWGDFGRAYSNYQQDQSAVNFALLLLAVFNALPNFGLLAAGWGGIGWAALKAAAKAGTKSPKAAVKAAEQILSMASKTPRASAAFNKGVDVLVSKKIVDPKTAKQLKDTILSGKLPGATKASGGKYKTQAGLLKGQQALLGKFSRLPAGRAITGAATQAIKTGGIGLGGKWKAFSRAAATFGPFGAGAEYPGWAPQSMGGGMDEAFGMFVDSDNYQMNAEEHAQRLAAARERLEELKRGITT